MTNRAERKARDSSLCVDALAGRCVKQRPDSSGGEQGPLAASYLMVAGDRIEPSTRGFSVRRILRLRHSRSPPTARDARSGGCPEAGAG
jgi:hypothetical protein